MSLRAVTEPTIYPRMRGQKISQSERLLTTNPIKEIILRSNNPYNLDAIKTLIEVGYNPSLNNNEALKLAESYGEEDIVDFILMDTRVKEIL
jgi:hypothetical protein